MKKLHLFKTVLLLCALIVGSGSAWAGNEEITGSSLNFSTSSNTDLISHTQSTFTLSFDKNGGTKPVYNYKNEDFRVYAAGKITISTTGGNMTSIIFNISAQGKKRLAPITANVGSIATQSSGDETVTWTGDANEVQFTVGSIATYGTESTKAGQLDFTSIEITYKDDTPSSPLASIALSGDYPIEFTEGDEFSSEGLVVTATYEDESESVVTPTSITGYDMSTLDESQTVTVSYTESEVTKTATYTIIVRSIPTHTLSSAVSPAGAGSVELSATSVKEGATATATATANAGFKFTGWSIDDDDNGAELSSTSDNPTTVTMGEANATITATFEAVTTYAIQWSVNGEVQRTDNVEEDAAVSFPASISGIPAGYTLMGWSETEVNTPQDDAPSMVSSATSTADKTYYAVMAVVSGTSKTVTLTASHTQNNTTYGEHTYTDDEGNEWSGNTNEPYDSSVARIGLRSTSGSHLESPVFGGNITAIAIKTYNGSSSDRYFYITSEGGDAGDLGSVTAPKNENLTTEHEATLGETEFNHFFIYTSGAVGFSYIKVTYGSSTASKYCTTVPSISVTVTSAKYATFSDNVARDFSESGITVYTALAGTNKVTLTEVEDGIVPANTGVVLYSASAVTKSIPAVATEKTELEDNEMVANVARTQIAADGGEGKTNYILANEASGLGFYMASESGAYLNANRAYLSTATAGEAREFLGFDDEGETTGIANANVNLNANENYYNLNGQRVAQPTKGLYIVNGKKYIVK